jgi:hypothetical protein
VKRDEGTGSLSQLGSGWSGSQGQVPCPGWKGQFVKNKWGVDGDVYDEGCGCGGGFFFR